jgi:hypothetical protein
VESAEAETAAGGSAGAESGEAESGEEARAEEASGAEAKARARGVGELVAWVGRAAEREAEGWVGAAREVAAEEVAARVGVEWVVGEMAEECLVAGEPG